MLVVVAAAAFFSSVGHGLPAPTVEGLAQEAEVRRHDDVAKVRQRRKDSYASLLRKELKLTDVQRPIDWASKYPQPREDWSKKTTNYEPGYLEKSYTPSEGLNHVWDTLPKDEEAPIEPVADRCFDGGHSGGHFYDGLVFAHGMNPMPPMTVTARIRTDVTGKSMPFVAWKPLKEDDPSYAEFKLDETGNLVFNLHDGYKLWTVAADPPMYLTDGEWHEVALVREGDNSSLGVASLYVGQFQVGEAFFDGWASHLQPWCSTSFVSLVDNETNFRTFEGDVHDVRIFSEALNANHIRNLAPETCTVDAKPSDGVHSNLGGLGPDQGEQALRFFRFAKFRGMWLDMKIINTTRYYPKYPERNGVAAAGVGRINLLANRPLRLQIMFVKTHTNEEVMLDAFAMSFFHVEQGVSSGSKEVFTLEDHLDRYVVTNKSSEVFVTGSDFDHSLTFTSVVHSPNRPYNADWAKNYSFKTLRPDGDILTLPQSEVSFGIRIARSDGFRVLCEVIGEEGHARDILFGGNATLVGGISAVPVF